MRIVHQHTYNRNVVPPKIVQLAKRLVEYENKCFEKESVYSVIPPTPKIIFCLAGRECADIKILAKTGRINSKDTVILIDSERFETCPIGTGKCSTITVAKALENKGVNVRLRERAFLDWGLVYSYQHEIAKYSHISFLLDPYALSSLNGMKNLQKISYVRDKRVSLVVSSTSRSYKEPSERGMKESMSFEQEGGGKALDSVYHHVEELWFRGKRFEATGMAMVPARLSGANRYFIGLREKESL